METKFSEEKRFRTIIVGDIHGCIDEFDELIKLLSYNKKQDRLILLGDLIDRGPDSVAVVRRAREMNLECVMGNHEHKFVKWFHSVGSNVDVYDQKPHYTKFVDADINYIMQMLPYIELPVYNTVIVHAGLRNGISLQNQSKNDLYYIRYMDMDSQFISLKKINRLGKEALGAHFWTEFWVGPQSVVYGHNVHSHENILVQEVAPEIFCYGVDTGCCFGGRLSAFILETKQVVQVAAKQIYCKSDFQIR